MKLTGSLAGKDLGVEQIKGNMQRLIDSMQSVLNSVVRSRDDREEDRGRHEYDEDSTGTALNSSLHYMALILSH